MKRDMNLIREILLELEKSRHPLSVDVFTTSTTSKEHVGYNMDLMYQAGLITVCKQPADNDPYYFYQANSITWEGQEFLNNVKDESNWKKLKLMVAEKTGDVSFVVIKTLACSIAQASFAGAVSALI